MRNSFFLFGLAGLCLSTPVLARSIMVAQGQGHECYRATLDTPSDENNLHGLAACNMAVSGYDGASFNLAASLVNRSEIYIRMERFREALADCDHALAIAPALGAAYTNRGAGLVGLKQYDDAIRALDRAITLGGTRLEIAYYNRGLAKDYKGDIEGAYRDYRKSLDLNPDFAPPQEQLPRFRVTTRAP